MSKTVLFWFRNDLRLNDNPGLYEASLTGSVLPIYIYDSNISIGAASKWWLYNSLHKLNQSLNNKLYVVSGNSESIIPAVCKTHNIESVYWNRSYEPYRILQDDKIQKTLAKYNISTNTYNGSLLWEPQHITKSDGTPYKVFTPYYRKGCLESEIPRYPFLMPNNFELFKIEKKYDIEDLGLLPLENWYKKLDNHWEIGEVAAKNKMHNFINTGLNGYKDQRNYPFKKNVSRLSPHLHFGEISPNQIWYEVVENIPNKDVDHFLSELGWREFSNYLLFHFPNLNEINFQRKFDDFPWKFNNELFSAWTKGETGYPIVDAGMRELWQTGYIHNRVRMIVASFLVKNLLIHWHYGRDWFWDCLVDADLANNSASWQWVAGSGADAAPYFRIFNPVIQGEKFDINGEYTRRFVPELSLLPNNYLFKPWEASKEILNRSSVELGKTYPFPIVDLRETREIALNSYNVIRGV
ncbi:MAG: deoxyribodipyrimidine photo-lyase [SAR202 cluster bacterium]|nr:deoxyribodipyrimidine photo-lyase [SAR202 cluster bacterium]|tara:strand:+ start:486 stop:1886 length:1401 start_codon:yes stop_codon:yes gene_type:complete